MTTPSASPPQTIVFFDGYCGLCNGVVDFLIARDSKRSLRYSPLQGETAAKLLSEPQRQDLDTVVVTEGDVHFVKSAAVLHALGRMGGGYALLASAGRIFPRVVRDAVYDIVAKNRYGWFGRRDSCRLPAPEERALFLP